MHQNQVTPPTWKERLADFARRRKAVLANGGRVARALIPAAEVVEFWCSEGFLAMSRRARRRLLREPVFMPEVRAQLERLDSRTDPPEIPALTAQEGVSIVIPVLNNAALTLTCLRSLVENTPPGEFEVIVVDNGSDAATQQALAAVAGLRVIRNDSNRGFVEACNQGASAALGRYILFLNNDTVALAGWLEPLRSTLRQDARNGAVGAMLVYPDGRLQEAGGIIWSDGSGWNYGRNDNPDAPQYGFVREVDYCSGACLMVKRELFEKLGGFDNHFAPAYYEDTDLCFRLREAGYRVLFQPAVRVLHFEGATAGTDVTSGVKQYQVVNHRKFVERHRQVLAEQWPPSPGMVSVAADRRRGPHVMVIDHMVPRHREDSGSVRMTALLHILVDLGYRVTLVPDNLAREEPYTSELQQRGIQVVYGVEPVLPYLQRTLETVDIAILCRAPFAHKYLDALLAPAVRPFIVFDTVDLHHLREQRHAAMSGDPQIATQAELTREMELKVAAHSDLVWVTSDHEVKVLSEAGVASAVSIVPNVHRRRDVVPGIEGRRDLLFIGGFQHQPNGDAVEYFVHSILPMVAAQTPAVRLTIVGSNVPQSVRNLASDRVHVLGWVEDVEPLFDAARLSIVPLRYGAGVKGKVSQSLALGLPVVTTPVGAEGMGLIDGEHVLIGRDPEEFARQVTRLLRDDALWERLSTNGRQHLDAHFGYQAVRDSVGKMLSDASRRIGHGTDPLSSTPIQYSSGFHEPERNGETLWRWMGSEGRVRLTNTSRPMALQIDVVVPRSNAGATVRIFVGDELIDSIAGSEHIRRQYRVSCEHHRRSAVEVRIVTDKSFVPADVDPASADRRRLGLILRDLQWSVSDEEALAGDAIQ